MTPRDGVAMSTLSVLSRQGQRLLQLGLLLLLFCSLEGFAIPHLAAPRLGLSVHTLSALQSVLLLAMGLLWTRLELGPRPARAAFWLLIYSTLAILAAYLIAAVIGAGSTTMPMAARGFHGSSAQEAVIQIVAYSSAPTGLVSFALILWGLRRTGPRVGA
jgi:hydroxylaminobenzene mutase